MLLDQAWPYRLILAFVFCVAIVNYLRDFVLYPYTLVAPIGPEALKSASLAGLTAVACLYSARARKAVNVSANRLSDKFFGFLRSEALRQLTLVRDPDHRVPPARVLLAIALLAAIVVALDIFFNLHAGLLTSPPVYDGVSYMMDAKRLYLASRNPLTLPFHTIHLHYWGQRAYVWHAALAVSYYVFGPGEWQSYTARWWPVFLYLTLIYWVVRKRASLPVTLSLVLVSALLPIFMPCVRGALWDLVTGKVSDAYEWYQDDLRPDLLFTVFVSLMAALLLESAETPDWRLCALAGVVFGLSLLTKPSAIGEAVLAAVVPAIVIIVRHWRKPSVIVACAGAFIVFGAPIVGAFVVSGQLKATLDYVTTALTRDLPIYRDAATSGWNTLPFYGVITTYQVGHWEWLLLVAAVFAAVRRDFHSLSYFLVGAMLLLEVALSPATNDFLSYGFLLVFWLGACLGIANLFTFIAKSVSQPAASRLLLCGVAVYCVALVAGGFIGLRHMKRQTAALRADRLVARAEEKDIARYVGRDGQFATMNQFGFPATMEFDWAGVVPDAPRWGQWYDPKVTYLNKDDPLPAWRSCRAVLVYADPMERVSNYAFEPPVVWPMWNSLRADLTRPGSRFRLVRSYPLSSVPLTVQLWVSRDGRRDKAAQ